MGPPGEENHDHWFGGGFSEFVEGAAKVSILINITFADVYYGKDKKIISMREKIKHKTMQLRKMQNLGKNLKKNT